jgi:Tol biopolymer transport system component/DNA-binding winged helix-turn-helix (wHTH) protein
MDDPKPIPTSYRFHQWHYEPARRLLSGPGAERRLKPLSDRLLRRLLDEPEKMLSRETLIEQVWTRRQVNDEVLSRAIAELRALLGDDAREPRYIETLSKGGYRWIAPVAPIPGDSAAADAATGAAAASTRRTGIRPGTTGFLVLLAVVVAAAGVHLWQQRERPADRADLALDLLNARPLTADPRLEIDPRFDLMGRVVYVRVDRTSDTSELIILDPASLAERIAWQDSRPLRGPAPSPDGREIAVIRRAESGCEIWSVSTIDLRRARLGDCAAESEGLEWTDGGNGLLFTGAAQDAAHAPGLMSLDRRSGEIRRLTTPDFSEGAHVEPRLSPDGKLLAYASKHGGEGQVWQADWPGLQQRSALLKRPEPINGQAWEANGNALWIAGDLIRYRALHRLRAGGQPALIGGRGALSIDLASNGAAVWPEASYDGDILLQGRGDQVWMPIARSNRYESQPEFSADGNRIALVSNRTGTEAVFVFDRADGSVRQLALNPQFRWVRPTWSTRDQSLVITAYEDVHTRLYRYRLDGDVSEPLASVEEGAFHGIELTDRLLYVKDHRTPQSTLMQWREGEPDAKTLELGTLLAYRASNDWLVWRNEQTQALQAAPWPALQPIRAIALVDPGAVESFALAGSALYYVDQGTIWTLTLPDGQPVAVKSDHLPSGSGPNLAASLQGDVAVAALAALDIDLMIVTPTSSAAP